MKDNFSGGNVVMGFYAISIAALVGCTGEVSRSGKLNQLGSSAEWKIDVVKDECSVANIVHDYITNGLRNAPFRKYGFDQFRQDRHSFLRSRYRAVDWNRLDYIVNKDSYKFHKDCQSTFSLNKNPNTPGLKLSQKYNFRSFDENLLCSFEFSEIENRKLKKNIKSKVQSCINTATGKKTFDVIELD